MKTTDSCKFSTSIRLPVSLEALIRASAAKNERSISNEIIFVLKQYYNEKREDV